ncbi:hypothetical protein B0J14DRAFT_658766 [Halenospora varia]|nr:hypothetical protein B0J14DRAFT_658766 [Halenospora varia]
MLQLTGVSAQNTTCRISTTFSNQEEVNSALVGCTDVRGNINLTPAFNGTLDLPGILNVKGNLQIVSGDTSVSSGLTAVVLKDLQTITQITLPGTSNLELVNLPSLQDAWDILISSRRTLNVSLPAVRQMDTFDLSAPLSSPISFPSLSEVTSFGAGIQISAKLPGAEQDPLFVDLPKLVNTSSILLQGAFSGISIPSLQAIGNSVLIQSTVPMDCTPVLEDARQRVLSNWTSTHTTLNGVDYPSKPSSFSCSGIDHDPEEIRRLGLGIGLGLGIPILIICVVGIWWQRKRSQKTRDLTGKREINVPVEGTPDSH